MWPKATNVLEEFYYHWRRERGGGGGVDISPPLFGLGGGGQWYVCAPHF